MDECRQVKVFPKFHQSQLCGGRSRIKSGSLKQKPRRSSNTFKQPSTSCSITLVHLDSGRKTFPVWRHWGLLRSLGGEGVGSISQRWLASCQHWICPATSIYFPWAPCAATSCCAMVPAASRRARRRKVDELTRHMFSRSAAGTSGYACVCLQFGSKPWQ